MGGCNRSKTRAFAMQLQLLRRRGTTEAGQGQRQLGYS